MVFPAATLATPAAPQGAPAKGVSETVPTLASTPVSQEKATPTTVVQTKAVFPVVPLIISTSDPFASLSQAVKDDSSLVVMPSSIPVCHTRSYHRLVLQGVRGYSGGSDDEPAKKKRVSESKGEEESSGRVVEFMGTYSLCVAKFPFPFFFLLFLLRTYQ